MNIFLSVQEGLREINAHKFRSFLTMLGVVLGVAALMAMFALTAGMTKGFVEILEQIGGLERVSISDRPPPEEQSIVADISPGLTIRDAEAMMNWAPLVAGVSPEFVGVARVAYLDKGENYSMDGATPEYLNADNHVVASGRFITDLDVRRAHRVCVLGRGIVDDIFPEDMPDPVGEKVQINGRVFTVVGIFEYYETESQRRLRESGVQAAEEQRKRDRRSRRRGWDPLARKNQALVIPISTFQMEFRSTNYVDGVNLGPLRELDRFHLRISDVDRLSEAILQARRVLLKTHRGIEDFGFDTREEWYDQSKRGEQQVRVSGGLIAGISLLVGGLGITNIMLASITERIRDIGIRRAIGAKARDIFFQILIESLLIAAMGALLGLLASFGLVRFLEFLSPTSNAPIVEASSVLISVGFALAIGVLAGIYPAIKASKLSPIEALRYE